MEGSVTELVLHAQATDLAKHALGVTVHAAEAGPGWRTQVSLLEVRTTFSRSAPT